MENQEHRKRSETYSFSDGNFKFWEGEVDGETVVIRVRDDDNPGMRWVEKGLPRGITIRQADQQHVKQWLEGHPDHKLN